MAATLTKPCPRKSDPRPENRVVGSGTFTSSCTWSTWSQTPDTHREIETTTTTTVSGALEWLSKDPIGISGGLNQYVAFGNNPVNMRDPDGLFAKEGHSYWMDVAVAGQDRGGIGGNLQTAGASIMTAFIDFWGARSIQGNAEKSGYYSGEGCTGKAVGHGLLAGGQIALAATSAFGGNNVAHPYYRYVGAGSRPLGKGAWLVRGTIGRGAPYGRNFARAANKLQIPPQSMIDDVIRVPGAWKKFIGGPRRVRGNPQWGVGGGTEYRMGMWLWP